MSSLLYSQWINCLNIILMKLLRVGGGYTFQIFIEMYRSRPLRWGIVCVNVFIIKGVTANWSSRVITNFSLILSKILKSISLTKFSLLDWTVHVCVILFWMHQDEGNWAIINLNLLSHIKFYATQWKETKSEWFSLIWIYSKWKLIQYFIQTK